MPSTVFPAPLHSVATASLVIAAACALAILIDILRRPQAMAVMNAVWPLTALFGSVIWLAAYGRWGRAGHRDDAGTPMAISVFKGASHCGAGCTLGDMIVEALAIALPALPVWFGYDHLFADRMVALWLPDFILAFAIGIAFQYWSIVPMRGLSPGRGIAAALKADVASITAWQVGMYGAMALIQFVWFRPAYGGVADATQPEFWFAMQIAMLGGFATSYPVNWLLVRSGIKEAM